MQVITTVSEFRTALVSLSKVVAKRSERPILECVRLTADTAAGGILLEGTDLESYLSVTVPGSFPAEGVSVFRLTALVPFLKAAEGTALEIEGTEDMPDDWKEGDDLPAFSVRFSTDSAEELELTAEDPEEYPCFPVLEIVARIELDEITISKQLRRVLPAVARDVGRYAMHGVSIEIDAGTDLGKLIGTDGRRLHLAEISGNAVHLDPLTDPTAIMPRDSAKLLADLVAKRYQKNEERRTILLEVGLPADEETGEPRGADHGGPKYHRATVGPVSLIVRCIDGEFPHYSAVIPASHDGVAVLDSAETLKRTALVASACYQGARAVRFSFGDSLTVSGKSAGKKSSAALSKAVLGAIMGGAGEGFAVNPEYLADAVKAAGSESVSLQWTSKNAPILIETDGFRGVVMPIMIDA